MLKELAQIKLPLERRWFDEALVLSWRELRDTLRDWRITIPIVLLTLLFPVLMHITASLAVDWVQRYGGSSLISERTFPFMLMVVGFFPLSFSLVIALEAFVGEKERKSLEPLLATPLTDGQLYFAKMLASLIPPVLGSYLGITVYLTAMYFTRGWHPSLHFVILVVCLTTAKAIVMVSGAVVVSSQTTSVRAANLLASFIIIPMTLLVQVESIIMFWANYSVLWWFVLLLAAVNLLMVRMGIKLFDREELLGREVDELNPMTIWRTFKRYWSRVEPHGRNERVTVGRIYRRDIPAILRRLHLPVGLVVLCMLAIGVAGALMTRQFPLDKSTFDPMALSSESFQNLPTGFLPSFTSWILVHNMRALLGAAILAIFSFGSIAVVLLMIPMGVLGFAAAQFAIWGYNPLVFLATFILPHGIFELPAAILVTAAAVRLGATFIARQPGMTIGENWLSALADFVKLFIFVALPLLIVAAIIEANVTLPIVIWVYGS